MHSILHIILGVNLQKYSFSEELLKNSHERRPYFKLYGWWMGVIFVIGGSGADFVALGLAPQSIVAPIGSNNSSCKYFVRAFSSEGTFGATRSHRHRADNSWLNTLRICW